MQRCHVLTMLTYVDHILSHPLASRWCKQPFFRPPELVSSRFQWPRSALTQWDQSGSTELSNFHSSFETQKSVMSAMWPRRGSVVKMPKKSKTNYTKDSTCEATSYNLASGWVPPIHGNHRDPSIQEDQHFESSKPLKTEGIHRSGKVKSNESNESNESN